MLILLINQWQWQDCANTIQQTLTILLFRYYQTENGKTNKDKNKQQSLDHICLSLWIIMSINWISRFVISIMLLTKYYKISLITYAFIITTYCLCIQYNI